MTLPNDTPLNALPTADEHHVNRRCYPHGVAFLDGQYLRMSEAKISSRDQRFSSLDATYDTAHV